MNSINIHTQKEAIPSLLWEFCEILKETKMFAENVLVIKNREKLLMLNLERREYFTSMCCVIIHKRIRFT